MMIGVMMFGLIAATAAALTCVMLGYGLLAAFGVYVLGGFFGMLSAVLIVMARQQPEAEPHLAQSRA